MTKQRLQEVVGDNEKKVTISVDNPTTKPVSVEVTVGGKDPETKQESKPTGRQLLNG